MTEEEARIFVADRTSASSVARIEAFISLLIEENSRQNLVSKASLDTIWTRHLADSVQLFDHVPRETRSWLDLGSGAGFPGLILAIARPQAEVHLVESRARRIEWLTRAATQLSLENIQIHGARLEKIDPFSVDAITARAFAPLSKLLNLSAGFSTERTWWVLPKGRSGAQEWAQLKPKVRRMFHVEPSLTDPDAAILVGQGKPKAGASV
jgi:16S rRNA (guanine527-N7)-methyltransferase